MTVSDPAQSSTSSDSSYAFDRETLLVPVDGGRFTTTIHPDWNINTNPNGGYAISAMVRAACAANEAHPDPLSVTTQFMSSPVPGLDTEIRLEQLRSGRRVTSLRLMLYQQDKLRLSALATMGDLTASNASSDGVERSLVNDVAPDLPPPESCADRSALDQGVDLPLLSRVDVRLGPDYVEPGTGARARMAGWIRFRDGRPPDAKSLPLFTDAFPPSVFSLWGQIGWVPTVELTTHVRRRPAPGWLKASFETRDLSNGMLIEDGALWDESGALVARSRQLAILI